MIREGFHLFAHTADIGIEAWGPDLASLFRQGALALFEAAIEPARVEERLVERVEVEAEDVELLYKEWLSSLLYLFAARGLVFRRFDVEEIAETRIRAACHGERFDEIRHRLKTDLKAVTYHQLQVRREGGGWRARTIVDV
jgi:SHS2 domain-containing protein